ncbi:MAG: DNA polymerase III subunit delta [Actinobacteria bacterium]|nr:MAG: DNA polymerase III subunit delta [Actinomycetota bacterium]
MEGGRGPGRLRRGRGHGQRHQRLRRSRLPPRRGPGGSLRRRHPHPSVAPRPRPRAPLRRRGGNRSRRPRRPGPGGRGRRHPARAHRDRRRSRPGEDLVSVPPPAAALGRPRRPGLPVAAVGVEQDLPGPAPGTRGRGAGGGLARGRGPGDRPRLPHRAGPRRARHASGVPGDGRGARGGVSPAPGRPAPDQGTAAGTTADDQAPAYLVRGDDPALLGRAVSDLVRALVGEEASALAVEDLRDDVEVGTIIEACLTPPFLVERRVVVVRDAGRFRGDDAARLAAYLEDPLATTSLVLVGGGGQISTSLSAAVRSVGRVVDASRPREGRARKQWVVDRLRDGPVRLDGAAGALVEEHLGEDLGRFDALLELLAASYGQGARLGVEEVEPFLGEAGGTAPWDLTDAIDRGETAAALENLHRLLGAGRHPLVILASLHNHYTRILRLEGAGAADEKAAAAMLGITGSTFPARKALSQARRLGHDPVARAVTLLADADLALKGSIEWPEALVLEVLVARLSRLGPRSSGKSSGSVAAASRSPRRSR